MLLLLVAALVQIRLETEDDKPIEVAVRTAAEEARCQNAVAAGQPCTLSIEPGPVRLLLDEASLDLRIDGPEALRVHHRDYIGTVLGALGTGVGIGCVAGGFALLDRPSSIGNALDRVLLAFGLFALGAAVGIPSLVTFAADLSAPHATVEHLPH